MGVGCNERCGLPVPYCPKDNNKNFFAGVSGKGTVGNLFQLLINRVPQYYYGFPRQSKRLIDWQVAIHLKPELFHPPLHCISQICSVIVRGLFNCKNSTSMSSVDK